MLEYLKAALLLRVGLPGLGDVPLNLFLLLGLFALGFGNPGFWLLGLGLEVAYLLALATNPRFQLLVRARTTALRSERDRDAAGAAPEVLDAEGREQLLVAEGKRRRILELYRRGRASDLVYDTNREALERLVASYSQLLAARQTLSAVEVGGASEERFAREIEGLEREMGDPVTPATAREAKGATLRTLVKRQEAARRRREALEEIRSYLTQIDAQLDLALESAAMSGHPETISADIDVASFLLDQGLTGQPDLHSIPELEPPGGATPGRRAERQ